MSWGGRREGAGSEYGFAVPVGWLRTGEAAQLFGQTPSWVRTMLDDPAHAEFSSRVRRRGTHRQFPSALTWYYACEAVMPIDRDDLDDFIKYNPMPKIWTRKVALLHPPGSAR